MIMNDRQLRTYVVDLVRRAIEDTNLGAGASAINVIAALGLPSPRRVSMQDGAYGYRSGRQICINDRLTCRERIEFTLFHELLHILIDEDGEVISQLLDHFYHRSDDERDRVLENLCNMGAAEFMMPASEFSEIMRTGEWRLSAIVAASERFEASVIACGFQFAHHNPDTCIVVICEEGVVRRKEVSATLLEVESAETCLHVAYTAYHPDEKYQMCRLVPVPSDHPIQHVWINNTSMVAEAPGFFSRPKAWKITCDIVRIGNRVFTAYYPKGRKFQAGQGSLFAD